MPKETKKRNFSLNDNVLQKMTDPEQVQRAKGDLMKLSKAVDDENKPEEEEDKEEIEESDPVLDDEDISAAVEVFSDNMKRLQKMLENKEYQEAIEKACKPMSVLEVLQSGEFRQTVPIVKGELNIEFRSMTAEEDLELKKVMADFHNVSDRYFWDLYTLYQQAVCVVSVNDKKLPPHTGEDGKLNKKKLDTKLKYILSMPMQMTATIGMHLYWFDLRVRKLFDIERAVGELKNG